MSLRLDRPSAPNKKIKTNVYGAGYEAGAGVIVAATVSQADQQPTPKTVTTNSSGGATSVVFDDTPQTGRVQRVTVIAHRADGGGRPITRWSNLQL